jgi:hypothetical protein
MYVDNGVRGFGRGWWQQDWPEAEDHFVRNMTRLTRVNASPQGSQVVRLNDERLFEYPWLYATQTGYCDLSDEELDRAVTQSLYSDAPLTAGFWLEDHPVRHSYHHLAKLRAALKLEPVEV